MGSPPGQVLRDRRDDLGIEVEAEVVARGEVEEPPLADADPSTVLLLDHGVEHRVGPLQPSEIGHRLHPALEPAVGLAAERLRPDRTTHHRVGGAPSGTTPLRWGAGRVRDAMEE